MANLNRFFISVVLPSILAITLFIVAIFVFVLPSYEKNIMEGKKAMISELTNSVCSLIEEYQMEYAKGLMSADSARSLAIERVRKIRYGSELKDYFWITDLEPTMIMHPYRPELIGKNLSYYQDPDGKLLFVESAGLVKEHGKGFIDYRWQWKDDSTRIVPKLSFVKGIPEWNWVVGTGIYLEDVRTEIHSLKQRLMRIALIITLVISVILGFIIRESLRIERLRRRAESQLRLSREKYKSLVEASTEGTLMQVAGNIIFSNRKFSILSGFNMDEIRKLGFEGLFEQEWSTFENAFEDPEKSVSREAMLHCKDGTVKEVVVSASMVTHGNQDAFIFIIKEVSAIMQYDQEAKILSSELQHVLGWINQPVKSLGREIFTCSPQIAVRDAAAFMARKKTRALFICMDRKIIGQVTSEDLSDRVLAPGQDATLSILQVMTSPVCRLDENAPLSEALQMMKEKERKHILMVNAAGNDKKVLSYDDLILQQENKMDILLSEIGNAENIARLKKLHARLPVLITALIESGSRALQLTRLISRVADAIHQRIMDLSLERMGDPPRPFAFIVMGSQGRNEQSLATDQDNAIILDDGKKAPDETELEWFLKLGKMVNESLAEVGYHKCAGENMAGNSLWNKSLSEWKKHFSSWFRDSDPQSVLDTAIFFDFRLVYGEDHLVKKLREHVRAESKNKSVFLYHMAQSVQKMKIPIPTGETDVKRLLMPLQAYLRIYALREGISATGSFERAEQLAGKEIITREINEMFIQDLDYLSHLRIRMQARAISTNERPTNLISLENLSQMDRHILKKILSDLHGIQTRLGSSFNN